MIPDDRDDPERIKARATQEDPWVMYLVVRHDVAASCAEVLVAAARATVDCVARHADRDLWREAFRSWSSRSFRKVTLRARGAAWERLGTLDHGSAMVRGEVLVRVLPPRLRSTCDALVRNLQVYNPDAAMLLADAPLEPHPDAMRFVMNPDVNMSLGKAAAQVSHAVLLCAWSSAQPSALARWEAAAHPCVILEGARWRDARAVEGCVVVRDAGLTEVAPGTETVVALAPGVAFV